MVLIHYYYRYDVVDVVENSRYLARASRGRG